MATVRSYLSPKTEVRTSRIHGRDLFSRAPIRKDEIVGIKSGHIVDYDGLRRHEDIIKDSYLQIADGFYLAPLDGDEYEGVMMFLNHSCEPNVGVAGNIVFVAMRDVGAGEELNVDYAMIDEEENLECNCGTPSCRKRVTGEDWKRRDLQEKYRGYFSWYIQQKIDGLSGRTALVE